MTLEIEKNLRVYLTRHVLATGTDKESFTQDVLLKVNEDDDVQFYWALLSQVIEDPHDSEELLNAIIKLWVTVRGFSLTASWMESYKRNNKTILQKSIDYGKVLVVVHIRGIHITILITLLSMHLLTCTFPFWQRCFINVSF